MTEQLEIHKKRKQYAQIEEMEELSFRQKPIEAIEKIRFCRLCGKKLSMYNPDNVCFCHPKEMSKKEYEI